MKQYSIANLSFSYPSQPTLALRDLDLEIEAGEFVLLLGRSGSGKSTLLRLLAGLLPEYTGGEISGELLFENSCAVSNRTVLRERTGFVSQNPEDQQLFESIERELAFSLENRGRPHGEMHRRVAEVAQVLGLGEMLGRSTTSLSSGELQKVMIGAALSAMPQVLILDEPGSQLSPYARQEVMSLLGQLNRIYGITIILTEHHLEECFSFATRVVGIEGGRICFNGSPERCRGELPESFQSMLPSLVKLHDRLGCNGGPVTIQGCRSALKTRILADLEPTGDLSGPRLGIPKSTRPSSSRAGPHSVPTTRTGARLLDLGLNLRVLGESAPASIKEAKDAVVEFKRLSYDYDRKRLVLDDLSETVAQGTVTAIVGENGAGKSTLLKLVAGWIEPKPKGLEVSGAVSYLSQDPSCYLLHSTVAEELGSVRCRDESTKKKLIELLQLEPLLPAHPHDLSTGQKQRVALATVLLSAAPIILLDEPTRGLDPAGLEMLKAALAVAKGELGATIVLATHDIEFAAEIADDVFLLSRGRLIAAGSPRKVFDNNLFFTTQINRVFRDYYPEVVTFADAERVLGGGVGE